MNPAGSTGTTGAPSTLIRPARWQPTLVRRFARGTEWPRGVVWFGVRSFWGHLRHLVASAIATEDIDSRAWMSPDSPADLLQKIVRELKGDATRGATERDDIITEYGTLTEALRRDVWIDYVSDTGDDVTVSRSVARLVLAPYELPDLDDPGSPDGAPDGETRTLVAPRGDVLIFGGDTAYPVATATEILNRVIVPWNQVLQSLGPVDTERRVLLGVPGNHDWYDGLDGFSRMFRQRAPELDALPAGAPPPLLEQLEQLEQFAEWAKEFVRGGLVEKPKTLPLLGYRPVQNASYFALPLAPGLQWFAIDRQLKLPDDRQRNFFFELYKNASTSAHWVLLPDPVYSFGEPSQSGVAIVERLRFDEEARQHFFLSGDLHHYERLQRGRSLHVTAGGGGAFLHPARIAAGGLPVEICWPDVRQSRWLLYQVPWKVALGRSGFLPHFVLLLLFAPAIGFGAYGFELGAAEIVASLLPGAFFALGYALIGGGRRRKAVIGLALVAAVLTLAIPVVASWAFREFLGERVGTTEALFAAGVTLLVAVFAGAWIFGAYLALLTRLGYEHMQAFTALDHPGFKHFLRLRVRADGSGIDAWCLGLADPLGDPTPVLVDTFRWKLRPPQ